MDAQRPTADTGDKRRVLVVDDDRDFADTLARLLDLEGYEVDCVYSTAAAQEALGRFPTEVALIDIRLGEGSGLGLIAALRRVQPEIVCIVMTAYSSIQTAVEALQEGAYDYLRKPFYSEHLLATLRRAFERIALARAGERAEAALRQRNRELEALNQRLERTESVLRQRNRELEALYARLQKSVRSTRRLATFSSLRELLVGVLEEVAGNMDARSGAIYVREAGRFVLRHSLGPGDVRMELPALAPAALCRLASGGPTPEALLAGGEPDVARLAFPLTGQAGEPIGLVVVEAGPGGVFTQRDREIGEILASFAGEAIRLVQALESLASSEERLRDVIDNSPSAISLKDLDGRFVIVNRRFEEWYGYGQAAVAGRTSRDILPEELARIYTTQWEEVLTRGEVVENEIRVPFADGTTHSLLVTKFSIPGAPSGPTGVGTIATDISDWRRTEEQLRQLQKTEALGHLTGGVAHDFNNLLAVIIGNLELLHDELEDDTGLTELLDDALSSARSGAELTHRLLAFGRRQTLHPRITDTGVLVTGMSRMLERVLGETIETEWILSDDLWPVEIDRNQLETSLLNLAINARDAMTEGGVLAIETANVAISTAPGTGAGAGAARNTLAAGDYVVISVTDSGAGMAPEVVERAIEPFFTTKDVGQGSGLGLSMVYGFVTQSGGYLEISSSPGKGTTVRLYLPRADGIVSGGEAHATGAGDTDGAGERILVVEDKADVRRLATRVLTRLGYEVMEAGDGRTALDLLDVNPGIAVLFTDVVLPGRMSGADLARIARTRHPALRVLFTSGFARDAVLADVGARDGSGFIEKPYTPADLARSVRHVLWSADEAQPGGASGVNM